jgi:low temperature requirement protein LtrA
VNESSRVEASNAAPDASATAAAGLVHAPGRRATWFELFFDLVFVAAVAQLSSAFAASYGPTGALRFTFAFLALWWAWLGHTFHASRFDEDRPGQRALGMAAILAVVLIGYGAKDAFAGRSGAFAAGLGVFKALLALAYLRERRRPYARGLVRAYVRVYALQAAIWLVSPAVADDPRLGLWTAALALDFVTPFVVARHTHGVPPHPEHLPERFGLFTIILLGESVAAAIHGLDHASPLRPESIGVVVAAALLSFLLWTGYFERARGIAERRVADESAGRRLRLWAYGHIPLYLGVAGLAAGTVALAGHPDVHGAEPWVFAAAAALAMTGVSTVAASHGEQARPLVAAWPHYAIAFATAGLPLLFGGASVVPACAVAAAAQVVLSARRRAA